MKQISLRWACGAALVLYVAPAHAVLYSTSADKYAGNVGQAFSKMKVTVGAQWLDIEEDAELSAETRCDGCGTGPWLVEGNFDVPSNTVITGALLWNDDTLLMGKLRGKADATHRFDSLVPVHPSGYAYDPLLVDQVGDSTYHLKLYPIADGGVRRIRLRYLVPVTGLSGEVSIYPVLARAVSAARPAGWTVDLRGNSPNLQIFHDSAWFPIAPPAHRALDFASCGSVRLRWTTLGAGGARAVRSRVDTGTWKGDYVLFTGKVPDSIGRRIDIKSETVFLWRWISPQAFFDVDGAGTRSVNATGQQAIDQSRKIVELSNQLVGAGNKVGLVADQGMNDTTMVFPLSDSAGSDFRRMKTWLNGVDVDYLGWRIPAPGTYTPDQGSLDISTNRTRFAVDIQAAGTLYSRDSGIVRHLVAITVGPVPSGGDLLVQPDLSALPATVSIASSQILSGYGCTYDSYGTCTDGPLPPAASRWPGVDLDGAVAARKGVGNLDSLEGVPLPKIRRSMSASLSLTSTQGAGSITRDLTIRRGPDGAWVASINAQAQGLGNQVTWKFLDNAANVVATWTQTPNWTVATGDSAVPRLWAASNGRVSLNFLNATSLAPYFGIVDRQYSLLAMPSDSMGRKVQVAYVDSGVPFLASKDIFWRVGYGENQAVGIRAAVRAKGILSATLLALRQVRIDFDGIKARSVEIRDLRGHKVADWDAASLAGRKSVVWSGRLSSGGSAPSGLYVVVLRTQEGMMTATVALP